MKRKEREKCINLTKKKKPPAYGNPKEEGT
jgi:hypothetical protein